MAVQPHLELPTQSLFNDAAAEMMSMLRSHLGFRLWIIGRVKGADWLVGVVEGQAYGIRPGHTFKWSDTFCSRMVAKLAPRFAADALSLPQYAEAPFATEFRIGSYLGVPLLGADGRLLGTLCAFDPAPHEPIAQRDQDMVETCARVLGRVLNAELRAAKQSRRLERTEAVALCDALTGLYNRRGWDQLLKAEESRCRRHGRSACVVSIDLDDLKVVNDSGGHDKGDDLIRRTATALRTTIRTQDIAARVGGDEFAILAVECNEEALAVLKGRIEAALAAEGIRASLGVARRPERGDLLQTWREADEAMYLAKRERNAGARVTIVSERSA